MSMEAGLYSGCSACSVLNTGGVEELRLQYILLRSAPKLAMAWKKRQWGANMEHAAEAESYCFKKRFPGRPSVSRNSSSSGILYEFSTL
jgi:hypothetical protein